MGLISALYNEATASTEKYFAPRVVDQVFNSNPTAMMLKRNAKTIDGGESLEMPIAHAAASDGEWFSEWDTYSQGHVEQIGAASLSWRLYTKPLVLSHLQMLKNTGSREKRFDLAMQKNILAAKEAADDLGTALFDTTTADSAGDGPSKAIAGLDHAVSAGTTVYAGITRAASGSELTWRSNVDSSTTTLTLSDMQTLYGLCQEGQEAPNLVVTTQTVFNLYYDLLTPMQRVGDELMVNGGFRSLTFNGVPVVVDSHCASGYLYMLNMNYVQLTAHRLAFFNFERAVMPHNQWVHIGRYFFVGNLLVHAPKYCGKMTSIAN